MSDIQNDFEQFLEKEKIDIIINKQENGTIFKINISKLPKEKAEVIIDKMIERYNKK